MASDSSMDSGDVVAWGSDEGPRRGRLTSLSIRFGVKEHHLITGLGVAGAVLAGLSLMTTWQVLTLPEGRPPNVPPTVESSVAGVETWGTAYLAGLPGLLAAAALTLLGSPPVRRYARLGGLGWATALLAILLAALSGLGEADTQIRLLYSLTGMAPPSTTNGPGPFLALIGVALIAVAIYLQPQAPGGATGYVREWEQAEEPDEEPATDSPAVQRPRPAPESVPGVVELEVSAATPFADLPDPRNR
jgi:hypothetical protein